jgi:putative membrane protein
MMDKIWGNEYVYIAACYSVVILCIIVFLTVFELVTKYDNWEEIKRGNVAVAMATGGKIFGIAYVFHQSILQQNSILMMIGWGVYGFALLLIGYFIFEFMTPHFKIDDEIKKDNRAVGFLSMIISIGLSFVIGAGIS